MNATKILQLHSTSVANDASARRSFPNFRLPLTKTLRPSLNQKVKIVCYRVQSSPILHRTGEDVDLTLANPIGIEGESDIPRCLRVQEVSTATSQAVITPPPILTTNAISQCLSKTPVLIHLPRPVHLASRHFKSDDQRESPLLIAPHTIPSLNLQMGPNISQIRCLLAPRQRRLRLRHRRLWRPHTPH